MRRLSAALLMASCLIPTTWAQESTAHLNPVVAKLAAGKTVYGLINTGDLSLANARDTARAPVDFVYADMEHSPLDFPGLAIFLAGLTDKAAIVAKKSAQPNVALFARFPPEADQSQWVVKQALDIGLMGVIFNGVDTKDQAVTAVRTMRYPPLRGSIAPRAGRHTRLFDRGGELCVGRECRGVRAARGRVAAQSRRRSAGHRHDRIGRGPREPGCRSRACRASARCFSAPAPTSRAR